MKLLIINGPNINMLGIREPDIYGTESYETLVKMITGRAEELSVSVVFFQSNHEGAIVDAIQQAYFDGTDGIIINPAAYTHTSIAIADALKAVDIPAVEVHISDVSKREAFRQISYVRECCLKTVMGEGLRGYITALDFLAGELK
ncbi:MAG: type II 3-dehydroquinate dehydratase [Eubacteriales bacterium]|nr:type II 3-dehydroquinate dehydratase [Eubacteriales bacterium]